MTQQEIIDQADAQLLPMLPAFAAAQETYRATHGLYFQGLKTHTAPPADGALTAADNLSAVPSYETTAWNGLVTGAPSTLAACLECDQYVSPAGLGWRIRATLTIGGQLWSKMVGSSPNGPVVVDWAAVPALGLPTQ